jgi:hypothetical protein
MTRRRVDPDTRYRIVHHEALRTFGRNHYRLILFGPIIAKALGLLAVVAGLMALWLKVDHVTLGVAALILAGVLGVAWIAITQAGSGVQARQRARAAGRDVRPGFGLGWAVGILFVMLAGTGWLALWSPYA